MTHSDAGTVELRDAQLTTSGAILVGLQTDEADSSIQWIALEDIDYGSDGSMGLRLTGGGFLAFPPAERERVSNIFLKLSTRHY